MYHFTNGTMVRMTPLFRDLVMEFGKVVNVLPYNFLYAKVVGPTRGDFIELVRSGLI